MARLSKEQLGDRGRFQFKQEEVELPELSENENKPDTVLVRAPSVKQRDELAEKLPDDPNDWKTPDVAVLFSVIVVDPQVTAEEAAEFLGDWPGTALDKIIDHFNEVTGAKEAMRQAAADFRSSN